MNEIAEMRHAARLTQQSMSDLLGIPKRTIENWESGVNSPPAWAAELLRFRLEAGKKNDMYTDLRQNIAETIDGGCWEALTGVNWQDGTPWQLYKLERDVEFEGKVWRVIIIEKQTLDPDDITAVDRAEDVLFEAWSL